MKLTKRNEAKSINWISTSTELPSDDRHVIAMMDKSDVVNTVKFDCTDGWRIITGEKCCGVSNKVKVGW